MLQNVLILSCELKKKNSCSSHENLKPVLKWNLFNQKWKDQEIFEAESHCL